MSRLSNDPVLHKTLRDFIVCLNRVENAEARGADRNLVSDLDALARAAALAVEDALVERGWTPPGSTIRVPEAVPAVIAV